MTKPPKATSTQNADASTAQEAQAGPAQGATNADAPHLGADPAGDPAKRDGETVGEKAEDVFRAFEKGRDDAIQAAAKAAPGIKRAAAKGAYMFCYYLAFGVVYSAELAMSAVPEDSPIRHGFSDGAEAAKVTHAQHKNAGGLAQAA